MKEYILNRKVLAGTVLVIGIVAILVSVVFPVLPQLMMANGITGQATAGIVEQLEVGQPKLENMGLSGDGLTFELNLPVSNPNSFPARVDSISYTATVNGEVMAEGSTSEKKIIPANGKSTIKDKIHIDLSESFTAGIGALTNSFKGKNTYMKVKGKIHMPVGPTTFDTPFEIRKQLN